MNRMRVYLVSLSALLLSVLSAAAFAGYTPVAQESKAANIFAGDLALKDIANYRQWTRVNEKPIYSNNFVIDGGG